MALEDTERELADAKELFKLFRQSTPSAPDWFPLVDRCVSVLMDRYISRLESIVSPLSHPK